MDLLSELRRLEQTAVDYGVPGASFAAPADDAAIGRLIDAVAPMVVPNDVITLYRWHNGCDLQWLDELGLQSIDELLTERDFQINVIGDAPSWLILSCPPGGSGVRVIATLDVPGAAKVEGLWSVETHDQYAARMYDGIATAAAERIVNEPFSRSRRPNAPTNESETFGRARPCSWFAPDHGGCRAKPTELRDRSRPRRSDDCGSSVGDELHAVDVAGVIGREEQGDRCDLLRAAHLPPRDRIRPGDRGGGSPNMR